LSIAAILQEALSGSINNVFRMAIIIIPLMIFIEIFQDLHLLERVTSLINPLTRLIGLNHEGNLPLMAGLFFGISYGAGIIINSTKQGRLQPEDIYLINLFLVICHSLFEDTLLFAAIGANWIPILLGRLILAILVCALWYHWKVYINSHSSLSDSL
jgi:hypothetical protein